MTDRATTTASRTAVLREEIIAIVLAEGFADLRLSSLAARLSCSKSTLYAIAPSKEQLLVSVVRSFFRTATERVEASLAEATAPVERIAVYLQAIAAELAPASDRFFADVDAFAPAREIYRDNTRAAARRVQALVEQADPSADARFIGAVAGQVMESIHRGDIRASTGLDDSAAYRSLAELIVARLSGSAA
ncbi:TetR/AcrR family transcriptional regulator [Aeromicrobium wangtongii]|uniref:TetR/AcrR family transcriptional regulator n=1 Tax=Aeromicrobium wangtongii TaxID=2969247 RepID=A0ABY5M9B3_9ACTN|nr:TetR/AcrR family transcriptional regulator [Aeromicrobium wangtongii]MCD9197227.1 TetR/AcrR family transcriptional regulator [Aeromicrobium wangtongii]MCL3818147.1 TetR/AcrR family transcriptional regulator [Aeromicrobium wangtongii]UUP14723.1 TetR/AcrR family transcriptional regulator [Aeromicrobium wangtongii]